MRTKEILDRIENIINNEINKSDETTPQSENNSDKEIIKKIVYLALQYFLTILKTPFRIVTKFLQDEIFTAIKKDAKLYLLILSMIGVMFVFFSVLWLFISIAVGVYFFEQGHSLLLSLIYSIGFQIISSILISLIALVASRKLKSLFLLKKLTNYYKH